ncbi:MAG TPA: nucleoside phosphorylase [Longilinea sp.]|nr:nucleoside phosphorylase [Longilinea sp.]
MVPSEELQEHTRIKTGDVGRYVLLPGDPGRVEKMAAYLDNAHFVAYNREIKTYTGTLLGEKVSIVSTGMGCPSAAITVEELIKVGCDTFIRVGTSGAMQPGIKTGDVAVVTAAIRDEGTTLHYLPPEFPAVADVDVVTALAEGARSLGITSHLGISQSKDSFYGEVEPERMPVASRLQERWAAWCAGGAICSEMEAAVILILASIHRKRAGGVMLLYAVPGVTPMTEEEKRQEQSAARIENAIEVAIEGVKVLIQRDRAQG